MKAAAALLVLALAVVGCVGPRTPAPPAATVIAPVGWRGGASLEVDAEPAWWRAYGDEDLSWVVETALADNADIAQAVSRIREAEAGVRIAHGGMLPSLGLSGIGAARLKTYTPFGQPIDLSGFEVTAQASYSLDLFGRLRNETASAQARLLASRGAADTVRLAIAAEAAQTYISLRLLDTTLALETSDLALRKDELARRQRQFTVGAVNQLAVETAATEVRLSEQRISRIRTNIGAAENALSVLIGRAPQAIPRGREIGELQMPVLPTTLPSRLLRRRPDLYVAEQEVVAADRSLDSARAAFLPDISLSASGTRIGASALPNPLNLYSLAGSILAPIFEGGRLRAGADAATARRDEAAFAYRAKALSAFREVEDALRELDDAADREQAAGQALSSAGNSLALLEHRFAQGQDSYFEVIAAKRTLLQARLALAEVQAARLIATVKLYGAMGGGWRVAA